MFEGEFFLGGLLIIGAVAYVRLWLKNRKNVRKVEFLFNALDSGDYAFYFSDKNTSGSEHRLNASLNRVKEILQHARDEQIEREKYFELILNSVDTGILVVEEERGIVLRSNKAACELLGMDVISHLNRIKDKLTDFSCRQTHTELKSKRVCIIGFSDIKNELANQETDSWVKLIRVLTHEIMNTVTPIISLSDTLLKQSKGDKREGLCVINQTSKELLQFIENYRKFTHVPMPKPELFYVRPFLERMINLVRPFVSTSATIRLQVMPTDLLVYADEGLISRVVSNVLKNAGEAIAQNGNIEIKAYSNEQEQVVIDITNDGALISDEEAAHIFIPFFTTKKEGSGIGLSISRQIMRVSNGTLTLHTDKTQQLTTFRIAFE